MYRRRRLSSTKKCSEPESCKSNQKKFRSSAEKSNETNLGVRLHFLLLERMISAVSFPTWFQFIFFVGEESARTKVIVGSFEPSASASLANVAP